MEEYWSELIKLAIATGMPPPDDATIFVATGALSPTKVISKYLSILWFLGWRCLYAETVGSRIDGRTLDLDSALKRVVSMLIGRLRAYGKRWRDWVQDTQLRMKPSIIPQKHQDKKLISQDEEGSYVIHDAILDKARELKIMQ